MSVVTVLKFLVLAITSWTLAFRIDVPQNQNENQQPLSVDKRSDSDSTSTTPSQLEYNYLGDGETKWEALQAALGNDGPDAPCQDLSQEWDLKPNLELVAPPAELLGSLQNLGLPIGPTYQWIDAETPKGSTNENPWYKTFQGLYHPDTGVIIAVYSYINYQQRRQDSATQRWHDVVAAIWRKLSNPESQDQNPPQGPQRFPKIRWIFRYHVRYTPTENVINQYLQPENQLQNGPATKYLPGSSGFNTLLGSPNGRGIPDLLAANKNALGKGTIKSVTLQNITPTDGPVQNHIWWHMWWEIGYDSDTV